MRIVLKDFSHETKLFTNRAILLWLCTLMALIFITLRLFYLQVTHHERYTTLAKNNRLKILPIPPVRGLIYDRNGVLLASNNTSYRLEVDREQVEDIDAMLMELGKLIPLSIEDISNFKKQFGQLPRFESVPLRYQVNEEEQASFAVKQHLFPGVSIKPHYTRYYPYQTSAAHVIGYVGRISEQELETLDKASYRGSDYIGKTGLEKYYESELHGEVGFQEVEANVSGRVLRTLENTLPVRGKNLYLNIDINLQGFTEKLLSKERTAVVAIEPKTGAILALVSMPSFDPNLFVDGIDAKDYHKLRDSPDRPLFNRAIRGQYPPGSTIKPFVSLAGLEYGVRNPQSRTGCRGWYTIKGQQHKYRCWNKRGHGSMNLHTAIEQSCDVYFYSLASDLGIDKLQPFMNRFSFGKETGIDLTGELTGLMPSREWKQQKMKDKQWYAGDTVIVGIGQGYMLATPLQLATATAALSTRGQIKQPRVAFALDGANSNEMAIAPSVAQTSITLKHENYWNMAIDGMRAVVFGGRGTARKAGAGSRYIFGGKTGTAQVVGIKQGKTYNARRLAKKYHDHALFIAFAPLKDPRIAVAVIIENGGSGSGAAAPIARKVMDFYLYKSPDSPLFLAEKPIASQ